MGREHALGQPGRRTARRSEQARPLRGAAHLAAGPHEPTAFPSERPLLHRRIGTWSVSNGGKFDTEATVPMPAGTRVIRWARACTTTARRTEPATILAGAKGRRPARRSWQQRGWRRSSSATATPRTPYLPPARGRSAREACRVGVILRTAGPHPNPPPFRGEGAHRVRGAISTSRASAPSHRPVSAPARLSHPPRALGQIR